LPENSAIGLGTLSAPRRPPFDRSTYDSVKVGLGSAAIVAALAGILLAPVVGTRLWLASDARGARPAQVRAAQAPPATPPRPAFALTAAGSNPPVHVAFKRPPRAGILFDVDSGRVLWRRDPGRELPIASLTKMMTALIVAANDRPSDKVLISRHAVHYQGSGIGVLPKSKEVPLRPLFTGLLLVSGNDAAIALAEHDAGSVPAFVKRMNQWGHRLGLKCSHFSTPSGISDYRNHSCAHDLAVLARADLANPRIARIVAERHARFPFPIKGHHLDLWNNDPFILDRTPGITGVKTGYTTAAGSCYVITRRIGGRELGVVLLNSPNPMVQVPALLRAGARAEASRHR
jgi:D-alanyl-D-alanine carboxypeptidase (penicillin-binding protein 5/6)